MKNQPCKAIPHFRYLACATLGNHGHHVPPLKISGYPQYDRESQLLPKLTAKQYVHQGHRGGVKDESHTGSLAEEIDRPIFLPMIWRP